MHLHPETEREYLTRISQGDEKSFTEIFDAHRNKIYTVAFKLTASVESAEEIVQDVFMKVWKKRATLADIEDFDAWLFIVTRNTVYSFLRSKAARDIHVPLTDREMLGLADEADMRLKEKEFQTLLKQAVDRLPPQQKQVYKLNRDEQLSHDEIGRQLKIAPETARKHLQYALRSVRTYLLTHMEIGLLIFFLWRNT